MSRTRLQMMAAMMSGNGGSTADLYVSDGLVFQLDGIDKGTTDAGKWVDLIGGVEFTADSGVVADTNGFQVSRNPQACFHNSTYTAGSSSQDTYTIEAVCRIDEHINQQIYYPISGICLGYFINASNTNVKYWMRSVGSNKNMWLRSRTTGTICVSMNKDRCYENGSSLSTSSPNYYTAPSETRVGRISGKIFALRIYNRLLTAEEMLYNQSIDNTRFNLGLTINT